MSGDSSRVVVGTEDGVWVLAQRPTGWAVLHDQLHGRDVWTVTTSPHQPEVLFAGTGGHGLFRSVNGGGSWRPMSRGLESAYVRALAVDPRDSARVYAAAEPPAWYTSTDEGETWTCIADGAAFAGAAEVRAMAVITPEAPVFLLAAPDTLWRTGDAGQVWERATVPAGIRQLAVLQPASHIFAATAEGLYHSVDAGATWVCSLAGACHAVAAAPDGAWLAAAIRRPGTTVAAIVVSRDAGATWSALAAAPQPFVRLAASAVGLMAIDDAGGLWYTHWADDSSVPAVPWQTVVDDLPPAYDVHMFAD